MRGAVIAVASALDLTRPASPEAAHTHSAYFGRMVRIAAAAKGR